jgi:hypothetical protein
MAVLLREWDNRAPLSHTLSRPTWDKWDSPAWAKLSHVRAGPPAARDNSDRLEQIRGPKRVPTRHSLRWIIGRLRAPWADYTALFCGPENSLARWNRSDDRTESWGFFIFPRRRPNEIQSAGHADFGELDSTEFVEVS